MTLIKRKTKKKMKRVKGGSKATTASTSSLTWYKKNYVLFDESKPNPPTTGKNPNTYSDWSNKMDKITTKPSTTDDTLGFKSSPELTFVLPHTACQMTTDILSGETGRKQNNSGSLDNHHDEIWGLLNHYNDNKDILPGEIKKPFVVIGVNGVV